MDAASIALAVPWLRLTLVPGVTPLVQQALLMAFGSPQAVIEAPPGTLEAILDARSAQALRRGPHPKLLERTLRWLDQPRHHALLFGSPHYPRLLAHTADPPLVLYARGELEALARPAIAIVGSRNATPQGVRDARAFAHGLSEAGLCVVSGLALGIDAAAHQGGLQARGASIAVMGTGPDIVYPRGNAALAEALAQSGCLLCEFALGTPPVARNFPRRNRLISGLARGVLVVEAGNPSGSLITARYALEQSREVFAIPGSIHSPVSKGCHALIREGATLVEQVCDVLAELGQVEAAGRDPPPQAAACPLLDAMGFAPISLDELSRACRMGASELGVQLTRLELDGRVSALPDGRFQRVAART